MRINHPIAAAEFLSEYGNVTPRHVELLHKAPTEAQLAAARARCHDEVSRAIDLIRAHHGMPHIVATGPTVVTPPISGHVHNCQQYLRGIKPTVVLYHGVPIEQLDRESLLGIIYYHARTTFRMFDDEPGQLPPIQVTPSFAPPAAGHWTDPTERAAAETAGAAWPQGTTVQPAD